MTLPAGLTEADVERAARAIFESRMVPADYRVDEPWEGRDTVTKTFCRQAARAALTAAIGDRVVVPSEPTVEMRKAGVDADDKRTGNETCAHIYRAMIAAAPGTKP